MTQKRLLIFKHLTIEHPGVFLDYFDEDGYEYEVVDFSLSDAIPALQDVDALWIMGGPMDVW